MQKTKKSVAKRFKLTARGKLVRRTPGFRHLLAAKSTKQKSRATKDKLVARRPRKAPPSVPSLRPLSRAKRNRNPISARRVTSQADPPATH